MHLPIHGQWWSNYTIHSQSRMKYAFTASVAPVTVVGVARTLHSTHSYG